MDRRKAVVRNTGNAELRSELGIIGDVVFVLEAVVPEGELVDHAGVDRPQMRDADLRAANQLALDRIDGLAGKGREAPAVAIVAVALVPGEGAGGLMVGGKHMINLTDVGIERKDWAE